MQATPGPLNAVVFTMKVGIIASSHSLIEPKIVMHMQWVNISISENPFLLN